jgi:hypothetical protein
MLSRNDNPNIGNFNFSVDSVFFAKSTLFNFVPPPESDFILLDGTNFLLLDGSNFQLLGS